jgi:crotonobetainyl-CoA:carnitine CoA-transferase CaiB-like acyl-CoA transferase
MVGRHTHKAELIAVITERLAGATAAEWEARFTRADVPCTRVRSVPELLVDPQALRNGALATVQDPALGPVRLLGVPVRLLGTPGAPAGPPPAIGAHTDAILAEAGVPAAEIARLRQAGVVR